MTVSVLERRLKVVLAHADHNNTSGEIERRLVVLFTPRSYDLLIFFLFCSLYIQIYLFLSSYLLQAVKNYH